MAGLSPHCPAPDEGSPSPISQSCRQERAWASSGPGPRGSRIRVTSPRGLRPCWGSEGWMGTTCCVRTAGVPGREEELCSRGPAPGQAGDTARPPACSFSPGPERAEGLRARVFPAPPHAQHLSRTEVPEKVGDRRHGHSRPPSKVSRPRRRAGDRPCQQSLQMWKPRGLSRQKQAPSRAGGQEWTGRTLNSGRAASTRRPALQRQEREQAMWGAPS